MSNHQQDNQQASAASHGARTGSGSTSNFGKERPSQVENNNLLDDLKADDHQAMSASGKPGNGGKDGGFDAQTVTDDETVARHNPSEHFETDLQAASRERGNVDLTLPLDADQADDEDLEDANPDE